MKGGNTGGSKAGSSGKGMGGTRAVDAALSSPSPFRPRTARRAMRASRRHIQRFAPEGAAAKRSRPLSTLTFADKILSPYVEQANRSAGIDMFSPIEQPRHQGGTRERSIEPTSWIFPRPWYNDELSWLAAARATASDAGAEERYSRSSAIGHPRANDAHRGGRRPRRRTSSAVPLAFVAPSFASPRSSHGQEFALQASLGDMAAPASPNDGMHDAPVPRDTHRATRAPVRDAWSPFVSFPALQAAEVMKAAVRSSYVTERAKATLSDEAWALLEYVAPSDISTRDEEMHVSERARERMQRAAKISKSRRRSTVAAAAAHEPSRAESAHTVSTTPFSSVSSLSSQSDAVVAPQPFISTPTRSSGRVSSESDERTGGTLPVTVQGKTETNISPAVIDSERDALVIDSKQKSVLDRNVTSAAPESTSNAAETTVERLVDTATADHAPTVTSASASVPAQGPVRAMPLTAAELLSRAVVDGGRAIAPVAGPRLGLPVGLGGAVTGLHAARSLSRPIGLQPRRHRDVGREAIHRSRGLERFVRPMQGWADSGQSSTDGGRVETSSRVADVGALPFVSHRFAPDSAPLSEGLSDRPSYSHSAFRAVADHRPRSLSHVAWSDRWLARFAGASSAALSILDATTSDETEQSTLSRGILASAPAPVFIAPDATSQMFQRLEQQRDMPVDSPSPRESNAAIGRVLHASQQVFTAPHIIRPRPQSVSGRTGAAAEVRATGERTSREGDRIGQASVSDAAMDATRSIGDAKPRATASAPAVQVRPAAPVIGDDESVSDDVFAAIARAAVPMRSASAERRRQERSRAVARSSGRDERMSRDTQPEAAKDEASTGIAMTGRRLGERSLVDRVLEFGPVAPGPGMRSALAASPVAPALHAVLPLPVIPSFDMRSLSGEGLARAYIDGVVEPDMRFVGPAQYADRLSRANALSTFDTRGQLPFINVPGDASDSRATANQLPEFDSLSRSAPDATFVAPDTQDASGSSVFISSGVTGEPAGVELSQSASAPLAPADSAPQVNDVGAPVSTQVQSSPEEMPSVKPAASRPETWSPATLDIISPLLPAAEMRAVQLESTSRYSRTAPMVAATSSALGSPLWGVGTHESMADGREAGHGFGLGQAGVRAEAWSVGQERTVADLAFDFVSPEMIVATRAFGFDPSSATQAARLSVAGQPGLTSMASAVDLAFIDTYQHVQEHQGAVTQALQNPAMTSMSPTVRSDSESLRATNQAAGIRPVVDHTAAISAGTSPIVGQSESPTNVSDARTEEILRTTEVPVVAAKTQTTPDATPDATPGAISVGLESRPATEVPSTRPSSERFSPTIPGLSGSLSKERERGIAGLSRRRPRGAFLWPQAAIESLGLDIYDLTESESTPLAALEVLAAKAVADVGIFVAPDGTPMALTGNGALASVAQGQMDWISSPNQLGVGTPLRSGVEYGATATASSAVEQPFVSPDWAESGHAQPSQEIDEATLSSISAPNVSAGSSTAASLPVDSPAVLEQSERAEAVSAAAEYGLDSTEAGDVIASAKRGGGVPLEFKALYVALSRSSAGRSMSPAVRAARALALSRSSAVGGTSPTSERAAAAWAVMPMVNPGAVMPTSPPTEPEQESAMFARLGISLDDMPIIWPGVDSGVDASRTSHLASAHVAAGGVGNVQPIADGSHQFEATSPVYVAGGDVERESRPALETSTGGLLSKMQSQRASSPGAVLRAGESLRSYVSAPANTESSATGTPSVERGTLMTPPTAAPPLVSTGSSRSAVNQMISTARSKRAAGDNSIPAWFEKAARQMFAESSTGGISVAEMTLIASAPSHQVAASPKSASSSPAAAPAAPGGVENEGAQATPDVEALALEVYSEICRLMEISRERNGEPWR